MNGNPVDNSAYAHSVDHLETAESIVDRGGGDGFTFQLAAALIYAVLEIASAIRDLQNSRQ